MKLFIRWTLPIPLVKVISFSHMLLLLQLKNNNLANFCCGKSVQTLDIPNTKFLLSLLIFPFHWIHTTAECGDLEHTRHLVSIKYVMYSLFHHCTQSQEGRISLFTFTSPNILKKMFLTLDYQRKLLSG